MAILDYKIVYINNIDGNAHEADFQETENIDKYTADLLVRAKSQQDRRYKFNVNKRTTRDRILSIAANKAIGDIAVELGNDLAASEKNTNDDIKHLKTQIPIGVLIVAYGEEDTNEFILLLKSDYDKFISEATGQIQSGLSLKNQIFKTCQFVIKRGDNDVEFSEITTSDSTKRQSQYWHKDFLELDPVYSNKENTERAYAAIKNEILKPVKKVSPSDFGLLQQLTVGYFRQSGTFDIDYFRNEVIGTYEPQDPNKVDVEKMQSKIDKIKKSNTFDSVFEKVPSSINDRIKGLHKLTDEMDLKVKNDIPSPKNVIFPYDENGRKGLTIISERGYEFAKDVQEDKLL